MRVALYQCPPLPLDVAGNLQRLRVIAQQAEGIAVVHLPDRVACIAGKPAPTGQAWPAPT